MTDPLVQSTAGTLDSATAATQPLVESAAGVTDPLVQSTAGTLDSATAATQPLVESAAGVTDPLVQSTGDLAYRCDDSRWRERGRGDRSAGAVDRGQLDSATAATQPLVESAAGVTDPLVQSAGT